MLVSMKFLNHCEEFIAKNVIPTMTSNLDLFLQAVMGVLINSTEAYIDDDI